MPSDEPDGEELEEPTLVHDTADPETVADAPVALKKVSAAEHDPAPTTVSTSPPTEAPAERSAGRRRVALVGGLAALLVGALGVTAFALIDRGPSDERLAHRQLQLDAALLDRHVERVAAAANVAQLREAGTGAATARTVMLGRQRELADLEDPTVRQDALEAHRQITVVLDGLGTLATLSEKDLLPFTERAGAILEATNVLRDGLAERVSALSREEDGLTPIRVDHAAARAATLQAARYLKRSHERLEDWRQARVRYRKQRSSATRKAESYRGQIRGLLASYNETRDDLQEYVDDVKIFNESTGEFEDALNTARGKRERIRGQLVALNPTAPSRVRDEHQALVSLLDQAITATDSGVALARAAQDLRDLGDYETSGFELPEYDRFRELSDTITRQRDSAVAAWERQMAAYLRKLGGNPPKRPTV
ncbi:hypothetical protein GKE82_24100 [Conexibacter sp. W3-3-2]|uniref:hypothetical protein n=1 Tax=Conexibacter sp. W3-3-2 TaxID=2675227 RepID=UPI0012B8E349|nr:hypothetical protein [Conexibacter sp. W3-3-2]MTD47291.1 hypothetical protein [Conexibacter sp. W3-3-2]